MDSSTSVLSLNNAQYGIQIVAIESRRTISERLITNTRTPYSALLLNNALKIKAFYLFLARLSFENERNIV